jgi:hypothetical protein
MPEIIFIYKGNKVPIQCRKGEKMKYIIERLCIKLKINKNDIYASINGKVINNETSEDKISSNENNIKVILIKNKNKNKNEISIIYKITKKSSTINIFGRKFIKNNKNKCKYIYENKEHELESSFDLTKYKILNDTIKIQLSGITNVTNMSY